MKPLILATSLLCLTGSTFADDPTQAAIEYRQSAMNVLGWNLKPMAAMVKGKKPYDQAAFSRHAQDLAAAAALDHLSGYPEDSEGDSKARPEIWLNWEDFEKQMKDFQVQAAELAKVSSGGDMALIKPVFAKTAKGCKSCHKEFKAKKK
jgi:cytochrome c556